MRYYKLSTVAITLLFISAPANASSGLYCSSPDAPDMHQTKPVEPIAPYCVNEIMGTHTCSEWEIESYNSEIARYNDELVYYRSAAQLYASELQDYVEDAVEYAECELGHL